MRERAYGTRRPLNLALQGGGALGAFSWGVLDRLSQERRMRIVAISGASAGALNAAVFATGAARGGAREGRRALEALWRDVSNATAMANLFSQPLKLGGPSNIWGRAVESASAIGARALKINPLTDILKKHVDIDAIHSNAAPRLYISATRVLTATPRIFTNHDLTIDALLASACLPGIHPTVMIDGEPYWDGGFSSNPPLLPFLNAGADETLLVQLTGAGAASTPTNPADIDHYIKRLLFSQPLQAERTQFLSRARGFKALEEIHAEDWPLNADLMSKPTARTVKSLFDFGTAAAESYIAGAPRNKSHPPIAVDRRDQSAA
ncbi:MAG: patatin-like phospholipase family protein [Pseudomonadota bacterium]